MMRMEMDYNIKILKFQSSCPFKAHLINKNGETLQVSTATCKVSKNQVKVITATTINRFLRNYKKLVKFQTLILQVNV